MTQEVTGSPKRDTLRPNPADCGEPLTCMSPRRSLTPRHLCSARNPLCTPLTSITPGSLTTFTFHLTAHNAHHFLHRTECWHQIKSFRWEFSFTNVLPALTGAARNGLNQAPPPSSHYGGLSSSYHVFGCQIWSLQSLLTLLPASGSRVDTAPHTAASCCTSI